MLHDNSACLNLSLWVGFTPDLGNKSAKVSCLPHRAAEDDECAAVRQLSRLACQSASGEGETPSERQSLRQLSLLLLFSPLTLTTWRLMF